jgi:hypothetical protein
MQSGGTLPRLWFMPAARILRYVHPAELASLTVDASACME